MKRIVIFAVMLSLTFSTAFAGNLCSQGEKTYFSCSTKKGKTLSICGSTDLSATKGHLQYRYGTKGKIELKFPQEKKESVKKFFYASYNRSQTSYEHLQFTNEGTVYTVFARDEGDQNSYGVQVTPKNTKTDVILECLSPVENRLRELKPFTSCDPDDALNMSGC